MDTSKTNAELINKNLQIATQEINELEGKLRENMSLLHDKQPICDELIIEMKNNWECITLMAEKEIAIKD